MEIFIASILAVAVIFVIGSMIPRGVETPRSRHSREMRTALAALQTRSEYRADARKYR